MLIKWEDLEAGDVVKLSKEAKEKYNNEYWFHRWDSDQLLIYSIELQLSNYVCIRVLTNSLISSMVINKETGGIYADNFPFFEVVSLKE